MNIALIGYRGTGKTTVAQHLALLLGWTWVDSDVEVELRAGKSIAAIFADDGEAAFRELEAAVVEELVSRDECVMALGGGAILCEQSRDALKQNSRVVWLTGPPQLLWERIQQDHVTAQRRPNLTSHGGLAEVEKILKQRTPIYHECAEIEISIQGKQPTEVAAEIVARLQITPEGQGTR